jgi:hypothetical protein
VQHFVAHTKHGFKRSKAAQRQASPGAGNGAGRSLRNLLPALRRMPLLNVSLERAPTRSITTQGHHLFSSLGSYLKLEGMKWRTKLNHFALKSKLYQSALKAADSELVK